MSDTDFLSRLASAAEDLRYCTIEGPTNCCVSAEEVVDLLEEARTKLRAYGSDDE